MPYPDQDSFRAAAARAEASAAKMRAAIESVLRQEGMVSVGGWNRLRAAITDSGIVSGTAGEA